MKSGVAALLFALSASCALRLASADQLYYFVDERGVTHFSNVPQDRRYLRLPGGATVLADMAVHEGNWPAIVVLLDAPSEARAGAMLDLNVSIPASAGARGIVQLTFDHRALSYREASADADLLSPGVLQIYVDPGIAAAFAAEVRFEVLHGSEVSTEIAARSAMLESDDGHPVRSLLPAPVAVAIVSGQR